MHDNATLDHIDRCLARELEAGKILLQSLQAEYAALGSNEADQLAQVLAVKNQALVDLDAIDRERDLLMRQVGIDPEHDDIDARLSDDDPRRRIEVARTWRRLLELGEECHRQNAINGALIQAGLRHTGQLLSVLRGRAPGDNQQYGPPQRGKIGGAGSQTLGKA